MEEVAHFGAAGWRGGCGCLGAGWGEGWVGLGGHLCGVVVGRRCGGGVVFVLARTLGE